MLRLVQAVTLLRYFNSIKVRLEPYEPNLKAIVVKFQFHKGTIRTLYRLRFLVGGNCISIP